MKIWQALLLLAGTLALCGWMTLGASLQGPPLPSSGGSSVTACAIGPSLAAGVGPTGVAAIDVTTAGFTCALNSDFSTTFFGNLGNWLGGVNSCGGVVTTPIWYQSGTSLPCTDFTITTDGSNGQVLDMRVTQTDFNNNKWVAQLSSMKDDNLTGVLYPQGTYIEWKGRITTQTYNAYNGNASALLSAAPFRYRAGGSSFTAANQYIESDYDETYSNTSTKAVVPGLANTGPGFPSNMNYLNTGCVSSCFDPTVSHTYGYLITNDGSTHASFCTYQDGNKLGCSGSIAFQPQQLQTLEQQSWQFGNNNKPTVFTGPMDWLISYIRIWTCSAGANITTKAPPNDGAGPTCSGPMVTS